MEGTHCGGEGGWTRVAYIDMTQSGATCPQGLTQQNISGLTLHTLNFCYDFTSITVCVKLSIFYNQVLSISNEVCSYTSLLILSTATDWSRVAYIDMTQSGATCPQGLTQQNISGLTLHTLNFCYDFTSITVCVKLSIFYNQVLSISNEVCSYTSLLILNTATGWYKKPHVSQLTIIITDQWLQAQKVLVVVYWQVTQKGASDHVLQSTCLSATGYSDNRWCVYTVHLLIW